MKSYGFVTRIAMVKSSFLLTVLLSLGLSACSGGGDTLSGEGTGAGEHGCNGFCATENPSQARLQVGEVETILAQAVQEANARGAKATIAVVDRVGRVLAVYRMAPQPVLLATQVSSSETARVQAGLEGIFLPTATVPVTLDDQVAISKAITGAYLSTEGNAFSSRTASQIVQQNFNPGERDQPGGPLFGVQFSQLACSDFTLDNTVLVGPKRSPLGLSADPGGFPLYKNGTVVGGIGVIADGLYGLDREISARDSNLDELIALAGSYGFAAPVDRRGDRITADGKVLHFSDVGFDDLRRDPLTATAFASLPVGLVTVPGYFAGSIQAGTAFGQPESGIRAATGDFADEDAFVFVDAADSPRFPPVASTDPDGLSESEVRVLLEQALRVANKARAQIRRPLGSAARVTISVVDAHGGILGMIRTRDAPVFGADVSLQKARTAAFFASTEAADFIASLPDAKYLRVNNSEGLVVDGVELVHYVTALRAFLDRPTALADGALAFSTRAIGNLARPQYPDGVRGGPSGPLSKSDGDWSVFSTGLQLDITINAILQHVLFTAGAVASDVGKHCPGVDLADDLGLVSNTVAVDHLRNGMQIFPGGVAVYRGSSLVGAIGVSGDGVDQDDMIAFLSVHHAGAVLGTLGNAPASMRADRLSPKGVRLRYIQCPQAPFNDSDDDNVCGGK